MATASADADQPTSTETCKAIWLVGHGGYDKLQVKNTPVTSPGDGEVRVAVQACGLNFAELMMRQGLYRRSPTLPYIPGFECSGTVESLGDNVTGLEVGQRVVCVPGHGSWSEKIVLKFDHVFPIPDSMSFEEAAAIPVNYITAYMMLFDVAHLSPGKKILVHMAAGGVGTAVTQLARTVENVTIFGTASSSKHETIRQAGVDHPIDYRSVDYEQAVRSISPDGVDIVLDPLGGKDVKKGVNLLRPLGITVLFGFANVVTESKNYFNLAKQIAGFDLGGLFGVPQAKEAATKLLQLYEEGAIKPRIDSVYSFAQVAAAQKRMHDRLNVGKIILVPHKEEEKQDTPTAEESRQGGEMSENMETKKEETKETENEEEAEPNK
ncbi:synaptic vesicle membrane protein VAT-1 homolog [Corticium candelabrum]|uniref:synaptic vesicle membrane protein VAT-1 homolog n=1 Tax=Corticium candelabrum TaxID=121492 RepID=UPI002E25225E|nr:synaptic vesicle membrane protein VAT-1 homolog [Corticium candelabrum]